VVASALFRCDIKASANQDCDSGEQEQPALVGGFEEVGHSPALFSSSSTSLA